jgi:multiple sugar transport system ATP-binding protein
MARIVLQDVTKRFGKDVIAVDTVSMEIPDGEFMVLVGPSGCGKTTLLRIIAGLEDVTDGEVVIGDRIVTDLAPKDRDVAMVFQNYALYPHMTVAQNIAIGLKIRKRPKAEVESKVADAAAILGLEPLLGRKPGELSGGQRQRVLIARALVQDAGVLLMDEPFTGLDRPAAEGLEQLISALAAEGHAVVIATHDLEQARRWDSVLCVNGHQIAAGPPERVLDVDVLEATYGGALVEIPGSGGKAILPAHHHHH